MFEPESRDPHTSSLLSECFRRRLVCDDPVGAKSGLDYHLVPVDLADPRSAEPLVDVSKAGLVGCSHYARNDGGNVPYFEALPGAPRRIWLRESLVEALLKVERHLLTWNLGLYLLDGYRPIECCKALWEYFWEQAQMDLHDVYGGRPTHADIRQRAGLYCSDPSKFDPKDSMTWPTHITGGAVDLTLRDLATGQCLYMGGIFDDPSEISHAAYYEANGRIKGRSDLEARYNRRLLVHVMGNYGFVNYCREIWHFDKDNQMAVANGGKEKAIYGPAEPPRGFE